MKKALLLLVIVLAFNLSNAQEGYQFKDSYKLSMAFGFIQKGSVTYNNEVLTISFKDRKIGNDLVFNFKEFRTNSLVQETNTKDLYVLSMLDKGGLVRYTIAFTKENLGVFSTTTKDAFTGEFQSSIITFN